MEFWYIYGLGIEQLLEVRMIDMPLFLGEIVYRATCLGLLIEVIFGILG